MPVQVDGHKLIPTSQIAYSRVPITTEDGRVIGRTYPITIRGKLHFSKGSPSSSGTFWDVSGYPPDETITDDERLKSLLRKQEALRGLFRDGCTVEFQPWDGSAPLKCNPRIKEISFQESNLVDVCDYTVTCEADTLYLSGAVEDEDEDPDLYKISRASEDWNLEILDEKLHTYRLTRSVNAVGKRFFGPDGSLEMEAWEQAQKYVLYRLGLGLDPARLTASGILHSLNAYNYTRSQVIGESNGSFNMTEQWICAEGPYTEEYSVNARLNQGRVGVSVEGSVQGFAITNNDSGNVTQPRYESAYLAWSGTINPSLFSRAQNFSTIQLHSEPLSRTTSWDYQTGLIRYSVEYDNRPSGIAGAITQNVNITDTNVSDSVVPQVIAQIPVLQRSRGPVLQDIGTRPIRRRELNIEIQKYPSSQSFTATSPNTLSLVLDNRPVGTYVYIENDTERFSPTTGLYSRNTSWIFEP